MTTIRTKSLVAATILVSFFFIGFGEARRLEKLPGWVNNASHLVDQPAFLQSDRMALVIGNSSYPDADGPLLHVANDAMALASALRTKDFQVDLIQNATHADTKSAIDRLKARVHGNSIVLIYFGGFAVQSRGQSYMMPVDAKIWDEKDVRREGLSFDGLLSELKDAGAHVRLAVIDASRRNPYERRFRIYSRGLAPLQTIDSTLILTSAEPDCVVDDLEGVNSPLVIKLLKEMDSTTRPIEETFREIGNPRISSNDSHR